VCFRVPDQRRRTIDIAFLRARLAVYIDGCFWHGCPVHGHLPKANGEWWMAKMAMNRARDTVVNAQLAGLGWTVLRSWKHELAEDVADLVVARLAHLRGQRQPPERQGG
jgi:DNA mismatch endonuclease, patch repair protein